MNVPVIWVQHHESDEIIRRGYWDQGLLELIFAGEVWTVPGGFTFNHHDGFQDFAGGGGWGAVVVIPGRYHTDAADIARINTDLARLDWCLVIITSDEESVFPWRELRHPNMKLWVMTPRPDLHGDLADGRARFLGEGYKADTPDLINEDGDRPIDLFFSGQGGHQRRDEFFAAARDLADDGRYIEVNHTPGFTQGLDRVEYLDCMAHAKIVAAPAGPVTADSFRLYEALEAGALPLADARASVAGYPDGYWEMICGGRPPFPVIDDWADLPKELDAALDGWPANANRACAWWGTHKRDLVKGLHFDLARLSRTLLDPGVDGQITVLMPTSPVPSHPDPTVTLATIASVRHHLPTAEIIVMADGVRAEQEDRRSDYEEYLRRLIAAVKPYGNVTVLISDHHAHQANLTRRALEQVRTSLILFVEHDTPLTHLPIDWDACAAAIHSGAANLIRFHHETQVLDVHQYLMLDRTPQDIQGAPLLRTVQWSQRPHLASAGFYRGLIGAYFAPTGATMIEDVMYGIVEHHWLTYRDSGWRQFRLWMYAPPGNIQRSTHLDGRASDPKYSMHVQYPGEPPAGGPQPGDHG